MTTKANKFGLRAAAAERRGKHAQRTPLPPRPGQVADAKAAIEEAEAVLGRHLRKLADRADRDGIDPTPKQLEKAYRKDREEAEAFAGGAKAPSVANPAPALTREAQPKAAAFAAEAAKLGWAVDVKFGTGSVLVDTVTVSRGEESITIEWQDGSCMDGTVYVRPDGTPVKLRNASAAKKQMASPPPTEEQMAARRAARERIGGAKRVPVRTLPFNPDLMTDEELSERLLGCKIVWTNRISGLEESDHIPNTTRVRVDEGASGRQVHFNSLLGARTVRVSGIIHIAGGNSGRAKKAMAS